MTWYIVTGAICFILGCLVTGNNPGLYNGIRKLFGK